MHRQSRAQAFSREFTRILEHKFFITYDYRMLYKISQNSRQNSCERLPLVFVRIGLVWPAANLLKFCRNDVILSTEM